MGNRGRLHDEHQQLVRRYKGKRWITCKLTVEGKEPRKGNVWADSYSELFFLDEATAYAAGHRPCWYCDREAYAHFCFSWRRANAGVLPASNTSVKDIDAHLHRERLNSDGSKRTYIATIDSLPIGAFIEIEGQAYLRWGGGLRRWSFTGYQERLELDAAPSEVTVLTPPSVVKMFASCTFGLNVHKTVLAA